MPFGGRYRLLDFAMSNMVNAGIRTVGVVLPYNMRPLLDHIAAGKAWNLDRHSGGLFMLPAATPAVKGSLQMFCLKDFVVNIEFLTAVETDYVVVSAGNIVANMDISKILSSHEKNGADITMVYGKKTSFISEAKTLLEIKDDGTVKGESFNSDCDNVFAHVFVFNRDVLVSLLTTATNTEFKDLKELALLNAEKLNVKGYEFKGYLKQIFTVSEYHKASLDLLKKEVKEEIFEGENKIITKIKDSPPTRYEKNAKATNSLISSGCRVDGQIDESVIFRNVKLKTNCSIKSSIIMQNCQIGENSKLENVILDKGIVIPRKHLIKAQGETPLYVPKGTKI